MSLELVVDNTGRPQTRGDCVDGPRPCPWSDCRYHLGDEAAWSCALDVADHAADGHAVTVEDVARLMRLAPMQVYRIEQDALRALRARAYDLRLSNAGKQLPLSDRIVAVLADEDAPVSATQLAELFDLSIHCVRVALRDLRSRGVVRLSTMGRDAAWQLTEAA